MLLSLPRRLVRFVPTQGSRQNAPLAFGVCHSALPLSALKARLMKELDGFLERDRDRELFDLPVKGTTHG